MRCTFSHIAQLVQRHPVNHACQNLLFVLLFSAKRSLSQKRTRSPFPALFIEKLCVCLDKSRRAGIESTAPLGQICAAPGLFKQREKLLLCAGEMKNPCKPAGRAVTPLPLHASCITRGCSRFSLQNAKQPAIRGETAIILGDCTNSTLVSVNIQFD